MMADLKHSPPSLISETKVKQTQHARRKRTTQLKHEPVSLSEFTKDLKAAILDKKLTPSTMIIESINNPFGRTLTVEMHAKQSPVEQAKVVPNDQLEVFIKLIAKKYPNAFREIHLTHHDINDTIAREISALLIRSQSLEDLSLNGNSICRQGCNSFTQTLVSTGGGVLKSLSLRDNPIGDDAIKSLAAFLATDPVLESIDLGNVEADVVALVHLAHSLETNTNLHVLNIDRPKKSDKNDEESSIHLAKALRCNSSLHTLSLSKHCMREYGTMWLMEYITEWNQSITSLDLSSNEIPADGAKYIAKMLSNPKCNITNLNLSSNRITSEGAEALAKSLEANSSLVTLDLSYATITDDGLVALCDAFSSNKTLRTLLLSGNKFGLKARKSWQERLGWPVKEGGIDGSCTLNIDTLDFIPLIAPPF